MQAVVGPNGVVHLADRVGLEHYPNVADFCEEMASFGASRRMPQTLFSMTVEIEDKKRPVIECLTPESRLLLIHDRAIITNWQQATPTWGCPKGYDFHLPNFSTVALRVMAPPVPLRKGEERPDCLGRCWYDVEGGGDVDALEVGALVPSRLGGPSFVDVNNPRLVRRSMPSFSYFGVARPEGVEAKYQRAFFASLPCTRLVVVSGPNAADVLAEALRSQLPGVEVPE